MTSNQDNPTTGFEILPRYYNSFEAAINRRLREKRKGNVDIFETMDLISDFLKFHQTTFLPHLELQDVYYFPFMFNRPRVGQKLNNVVTKEEYRIEELFYDSDTRLWNGAVKLNIEGNRPTNTNRDVLKFVPSNQDHYVNFEPDFPTVLINQNSSNSEGNANSVPNLNPTITWGIIRSEPGSLGKRFDSKQELNPRLREITKDPLVKGYSVSHYGQLFQHVVQFDFWSKNPKESEALLKWFQGFMSQYTPGLKRCGLSQCLYHARLIDDYKRSWRQGVYVKSLQYYMITEELYEMYERDLVKLDIYINHADSSSLVRPIDSERRYIAGQLVTGELSNQDYKDLFYRSGEYMFGEVYYNQ